MSSLVKGMSTKITVRLRKRCATQSLLCKDKYL